MLALCDVAPEAPPKRPIQRGLRSVAVCINNLPLQYEQQTKLWLQAVVHARR